MELYFSSETWFIISSILTPIGYVIQDVVADAMTVEAVENKNTKFNYKNKISKRDEHMLLQLYGRFSIILGSLLVGLLNVYIFSDIKSLNKEGLLLAYANIYLIALFIPILSVSGVILSKIFKSNFELKLTAQNKTNNLDLKIFWEVFFLYYLQYYLVA